MASDQSISTSKSCYLTSKNMAQFRSDMIQEVTGFAKGSLPFTYLGCTIFKGLTKQAYFEPIIMKIQKKVAGWK